MEKLDQRQFTCQQMKKYENYKISIDLILNIFLLQMDVFDCAERYARDNVSLILIAGKDYGSGSSRDWAAKGPYLLVRCIIYIIYIIITFAIINF